MTITAVRKAVPPKKLLKPDPDLEPRKNAIRDGVSKLMQDIREEDLDKPSRVITLWSSSGNKANEDTPPALWIHPDMAVASFLVSFKGFLKEYKPTKLQFTGHPKLEKWHMTRADNSMQQRIAEPRWTVRCRIGLFD